VQHVQQNSDGLAQANTRLNRQLIAIAATNARLENQLRADCGFYGHLAGLPVTTNITTGRPTRLSVQLISDVRVAWTGHGCQGKLTPPDPSFTKWAAFYHLPVN